jgi:Ca2+-binding RTX toxin-like protein
MLPEPASLLRAWFAVQFDDLRGRLEILDRKVTDIQRKDTDMSDALNRLTASVAALLPVVGDLVTAVAANDTELATLANNLRNRTNPDDSVALNALADQVDQMRANLSTANGAAAASLAAATAAGDDSVSGGAPGDDTVAGAAGDDTTTGAAGTDGVDGTAGDDTTGG